MKTCKDCRYSTGGVQYKNRVNIAGSVMCIAQPPTSDDDKDGIPVPITRPACTMYEEKDIRRTWQDVIPVIRSWTLGCKAANDAQRRFSGVSFIEPEPHTTNDNTKAEAQYMASQLIQIFHEKGYPVPDDLLEFCQDFERVNPQLRAVGY